jgi:hypothetical protein
MKKNLVNWWKNLLSGHTNLSHSALCKVMMLVQLEISSIVMMVSKQTPTMTPVLPSMWAGISLYVLHFVHCVEFLSI